MNQRFENGGNSKEFNLRDMAQSFMDGLQRHADMLAFNLASRESVQEQAYKRRAAAPQIMPAGKRHQNFEQMQAYARDLLLRQAINDCIGLSITALNNSHFFFALLKESGGSKKFSAEAQKSAEERHKHFVNSPLGEKFTFLEQEYGLHSDYKETLFGLTLAMKALVENNGMLKAEYLSDLEDKAIVLKIKKLSVEKEATTEEKGVGRILDEAKVFRAGEAIVLSDVEIQRLLVTIASFADTLFKSVAQYAQKLRKNG